MKLAIPSFGKKKDPKYWEAKLDIAQTEFWNRNYERAKILYLDISHGLVEVKSNPSDTVFRALMAETSVGLWSIEYINCKSCEIKWQQFAALFPKNTRILVFIAKVLGSRWDLSQDALKLYQQFLIVKPSEKNARNAWILLQKADYSDQAFALQKKIVEIIEDDVDLLVSMLKWSLKGRNYPLASSLAEKIIQKEPDHNESHRCLGFIAESKKEWEKAAIHYQIIGEWIRLAVVWNHCGQNERALSALRKVPELEQNDPTWLYHIGWCMYKTGDSYRSIGFWKQLGNNFPGYSAKVDQAIVEIQVEALFNLLKNEQELELKSIPSGPEPYFSEAILRKSLIELMINRDPKAASAVFEKSGIRYKENEKLASIDHAIRAALSEDPQLDQFFIEQLTHRFGYADLYLLLRSLWLAPIDYARANSLLGGIKLDQTGIYREGKATLGWLIHRLSATKEGVEQKTNRKGHLFYNYDISLDPSNPFYQAILNSYVSSLLRDIQIDELEKIEKLLPSSDSNSPIRMQILALYWAISRKWLQAFRNLE